MTEPTDAELKAMWQLHAADIGGIFYYARAVLAKWGQPAQAAEPFGYVHQLPSGSEVFARTRDFYPNAVPVFTTPQPTQAQAAESVPAVDEVAERYRNAIASACEGWTMPDGLRKHLETALWSPPTPQPTQAQAAEPVAWLDPWTGTKVTTDYDAYGKHGIPLVRQQPVAREPLTDAQREKIIEAVDWYNFPQDVIDAVERAHGITQEKQ